MGSVRNRHDRVHSPSSASSAGGPLHDNLWGWWWQANRCFVHLALGHFVCYAEQMSTSLEPLLLERFGFGSFRPGQVEVIQALIGGRSALAVFPTGGGKSLCYQLPALQIDGLTVVVSPLIALMKDQIDFLKGRGIPAARVDSTVGSEESFAVSRAIEEGELKLLYVAPERFNNERFVAEMKRARIGLFAIDEAHCISEWGHNFRPDYLKLAETAVEIGAERVLALTATATPSVVADICRSFKIDSGDAMVTGFYRPNLEMLTTPVSNRDRDGLLLSRLRQRSPGSGIVYVTLQKTAETVAAFLSSNGLSARAYHAGMDPEVRHETQDWWIREPAGIVVATIAFGMGIDKSNVRYVYHYNLPKGLESYSQEIGRAGRDGLPSVVEMLACADDVPVLENFAYGDTPSEDSIQSLVATVLSRPTDEPVPVSYYDLSGQFDMRILVLRTALTYLELLGVIRSGTPIYTGYDLKPLRPVSQIAGQFPGVHGEFVRDLLGVAKMGRIWLSLNPDVAASKLGVERKRVVRAIDVMERQGLIEVKAGDVRIPYTRRGAGLSSPELVADLLQRFHRREDQEIARIQQVLRLVQLDRCQVNELVGYFGEVRSAPCGHCSWCLTGQAQTFPVSDIPPIALSRGELNGLRNRCPQNLRTPRHLAKILCGLGSPAFTKAKLTRDSLFGALEQHRFSDVVAWCEQAIG